MSLFFTSNHRIILIFVMLLSCSVAHCMPLKEREFIVAQAIKNGYITRDSKGFHVIKKNKKFDVQSCFVDKDLMKYNPQQLNAFLQCGYMESKRMSDGQYTIKKHVRGLGGGPVLAAAFYCVTKGLCYAGVIGSGSAVIATTGGFAGGIIAGGLGIAAAGTGTATAAATTVGIVASGVGASASATAAATSAAAVMVAATGSIVTGIEAASWGAAAIGAMIPFL